MSAPAVGRLLTYSWADYYKLLQKLAVRRDGKNNLFDQEESYLKTLEVVGPIMKKRFDQLKSDEFRYLIGGKETCPNTGYFGSLTGAVGGVPALMRDRGLRRDITRLLPKVQKARSRESALAAGRRFFLRIVKTKGIKNAVATRFLSLARPDLFMSVNNESVKRLSRILGVTPSRIKDWDGYELAVRKLWQSRWYQSKRPTKSREAKVWAARAALVDIYASEYKW